MKTTYPPRLLTTARQGIVGMPATVSVAAPPPCAQNTPQSAALAHLRHVVANMPMPLPAPVGVSDNAASAPRLPYALAAAAYGNKAANLLELQRLSATITGATVPLFLPVSHARVQAHLRQHASGFDFEAAWSSFVAAQGNAKSITRAASAILQTLCAHVEAVFNRAPIADVVEWFDAQPNDRLMVRSTGREDSSSLENAGGNDSIANVACTREAVSSAVGRVVSSYFSERSMRQRLQAGDDVRAEPFFPVLLQVMMAEQPGGAVPTSGVMFTAELEGPTPGVTVISASFGHNDGIVNASVRSDTCYIDRYGAMHEVARLKDERLVPTVDAHDDNALVRVTNAPRLRRARAITQPLAQRLVRLGKMISESYAKPMDVEWTYDPTSDVISLLQARPLVERPRGEPSYLRPHAIDQCASLAAIPILSDGARVRIATHPDHVIIADTLALALDAFCLLKDRDVVKAVLVQGAAPSTSHEATTFRAAGLAVLQVHGDLRAVRRWLERGIVCIDTQLGAVVHMDRALLGGTDCTPDQVRLILRANGALCDGLARHPIPSRQSILRETTPEQLVSIVTFVIDLLTDVQPMLLPKMVTYRTAVADNTASVDATLAHVLADLNRVDTGTAPASPSRTLNQLVGRLKKGDTADKLLSLTALLQVTIRLTALAARDPGMRSTASRLLRQIFLDARGLYLAHVTQVERPEMLYALTWLASNVNQEICSDTIDEHSLLLLINEVAERRRVVSDASSPMQDRQVAYGRVAKLAMGPRVLQAWLGFTHSLQQRGSDATHGMLTTMLYELSQADVLGLWLNTSFFEAYSDCEISSPTSAAIACMRLLAQEFTTRTNLDALRMSRAQRALQDAWHGRIGEWGDVRRFDTLWNDFSQSFAPDAARQAIEPLYNEGDQLARFLMIGNARQWIELYDASIKSLVGSTSYSPIPRERARRWLTMLTPFTAVMAQWVGLADHKQTYAAQLQAISDLHATLEATLCDPHLTAAQVNDMLLPSPGFSVAAATFGSGAARRHCTPKTMHDAFSLVHQSALAALSKLEQSEGYAITQLLPAPVAKFAEAIARVAGHVERHATVGPALLQAVSFDYPTVSLEYAMTLREHSARFKLSYDNNNTDVQRVQLGIDLCGETEGARRMERIMMYAALVSHACDIPFKRGAAPAFSRNLLHFTWDLDLARPAVSEFIKHIDKHMANVVNMSFAYADGSHYSGNAASALNDLLNYARRARAKEINLATLPDITLTAYPWLNHEIIKRVKHRADKERVAAASLAAGSGATDRLERHALRKTIDYIDGL